ncbi:uncharacterized protein [Choristoneura fumiferana]|uniref:uncharacterized protein n=1 Tax=Choristoneura fumiferana TaxID=7141 RepID=UPI003D157AD4
MNETTRRASACALQVLQAAEPRAARGARGAETGLRAGASGPQPTLKKHESYPQYTGGSSRPRTLDHEIGSLLIRAVTYIDRSANSSSASTSFEAETPQTRASHTPAVRSGPPLSCNFCWNTVDECGRILRRKTQYHCPECRTNLCIVPCFHEYHEGPEADAAASAREASSHAIRTSNFQCEVAR